MTNVIAVIWDFDKTLINGYMQDPIFKDYGVDTKVFWDEVDSLPQLYYEEQGVKVNPETIYLNHFIKYAKNGTLKGLNNAKLREFGKKLNFYKGIPEIFKNTKEMIEKDKIFKEYDIKVEHYIVSAGMSEIIKGSVVMPYIENVWGCEFIEVPDENGNPIIGEIGYVIDNTSKTRALFEINKGVGKYDKITVDTKLSDEQRRVHFANMIYVADGSSDIPAFSVVNKNGGTAFAVYPRGDNTALRHVEQMRRDGRVQMYAEADYTAGSTAYMWLCNKITELAENIRTRKKTKHQGYSQ